jgi:hypothetical protein
VDERRVTSCIPPPRFSDVDALCDMVTWLGSSPLRSNENERVPSDMRPTVAPKVRQ